MPDQIIIERLEFRGRCGVTAEERAIPQPLAVDLELQHQLKPAELADNLAHTIDYAKVIQRVIEIGTCQDTCLLETMAERLLTMFFQEFPVKRVKLWIRKLHPPISSMTRSVGITVDRTRGAQQVSQASPAPAQFLVEQLHRLPRGRALDVASGMGRHSLYLASHGYQVDAIDQDNHALEQLSADAQTRNLNTVVTRTLDLEQPPPFAPDLGKEVYEVIIVFFYLYRPLFPCLIEALKPGGVLMYETFTTDNHVHHHHPKRLEFCLAPNELLRLTPSLRVLHYDEGGHTNSRTSSLAYTAQLIAHKPTRETLS